MAYLLWTFIVLFEYGITSVLTEDCEDLDFVPGYNLAGEGFDIVTLRRKTHSIIDMSDSGKGKECQSYRNTQLHNTPFQKVPLTVSDWKPRSKCTASISTQTYKSSNEFQDSLSFQIKNDWAFGLSISGGILSSRVVGSGSNLARFTQSQTRSGQNAFDELKLECKMYDYSLNTISPPLSHAFVQAVQKLPVPKNDKPCIAYKQFIDDFGTHYFNKVTLGGRINCITSVNLCEARSRGLTFDEVTDCLNTEASFNLDGSGKLNPQYKNCLSKAASSGINVTMSSVFNKRLWDVIGGDADEMIDVIFSSNAQHKYEEWVESLASEPEVIEYSVKPLYSVIQSTSKYGVESASKIAAALKLATETYISQQADQNRLCAERCEFKCVENKSPNRECVCMCNPSLHVDENCCPETGFGYLTISDLRATDVTGDWFSKADPFIRSRGISPALITDIKDNTNNAVWNNTWDLGLQVGGNVFRLELLDKDIIFDDSCGFCDVRIEQRLNPLVTCPVSSGMDSGIIHFRLTFKCDAYYTGRFCNVFDENLQNTNASSTCYSDTSYSWSNC